MLEAFWIPKSISYHRNSLKTNSKQLPPRKELDTKIKIFGSQIAKAIGQRPTKAMANGQMANDGQMMGEIRSQMPVACRPGEFQYVVHFCGGLRLIFSPRIYHTQFWLPGFAFFGFPIE